MEQFSEVVDHIKETIQDQMSSLQKQHQEFVDHIMSMLRLLDAQVEKEGRKDTDDEGTKDTQVSKGGGGARLHLPGRDT